MLKTVALVCIIMLTASCAAHQQTTPISAVPPTKADHNTSQTTVVLSPKSIMVRTIGPIKKDIIMKQVVAIAIVRSVGAQKYKVLDAQFVRPTTIIRVAASCQQTSYASGNVVFSSTDQCLMWYNETGALVAVVLQIDDHLVWVSGSEPLPPR